MIFWNAESFMDEAIRSVLAQTWPAVELVLCDDGSSDTSTALALRWAAQHPRRVRYVQHAGHAHRGMSATRRLGWAAARGELVAFLDADDVWLPEHLKRQVECLSGHPEVAAVCGSAMDWHSWDNPDRPDSWSPLPGPGRTVLLPPAMMTAVLREGSLATPICSVLVRRSAVAEFGGFEESFPSMYEDQVFLAKLYLSKAVVLCDARTAWYRQHAGSSTAEAIRRGDYHPIQANRSREAFLRWLSSRPETQGDQVEEALRTALDHELAPYRSVRARVRWRARAVGDRGRHLAGAGVRRLFLRRRRAGSP